MKKTLTLVGTLICAAALTLAGCAQAPGTGTALGSPQCFRQRQRQRFRCCFQGLHDLRHERL